MWVTWEGDYIPSTVVQNGWVLVGVPPTSPLRLFSKIGSSMERGEGRRRRWGE